MDNTRLDIDTVIEENKAGEPSSSNRDTVTDHQTDAIKPFKLELTKMGYLSHNSQGKSNGDMSGKNLPESEEHKEVEKKRSRYVQHDGSSALLGK